MLGAEYTGKWVASLDLRFRKANFPNGDSLTLLQRTTRLAATATKRVVDTAWLAHYLHKLWVSEQQTCLVYEIHVTPKGW
jgi:hypothetical protein